MSFQRHEVPSTQSCSRFSYDAKRINIGIMSSCPCKIFFALALALLHGMLAASTTPSAHQDCGCIWQQEYKSMDAAIKLGRHPKRYTAVSYHDMGKTPTCTGCPL